MRSLEGSQASKSLSVRHCSRGQQYDGNKTNGKLLYEYGCVLAIYQSQIIEELSNGHTMSHHVNKQMLDHVFHIIMNERGSTHTLHLSLYGS